MSKVFNFKNLIFVLSFGFLSFILGSQKIYADSRCEAVYGGGEVCVYDTIFKITKEVRIQGDTDWKDKVTDVEDGDVVEFRITVTNKSDDEANSADDMKMEDFLPSELSRIGGSDLTEYWDDFLPGEVKKFTFEAKVKSSEYDKDVEFDKCVVNKAELRWDGDFQGSDTATVCYGNIEPAELPKTGAFSTLGLSGLGLLISGLVSKKSSKKR
ncbi:DUF11 domain-containing protein [Patescibacteria group bacterium]|nr:DUF11 domain-containing protein [Patescibacteria group bacterium]